MGTLSKSIGNRVGRGMSKNKLSAALLAKFLFLWTGRYDGDDLLSDLSSDVITVTDKDWTGRYIPPTTSATIAVPDTSTYVDADGSDDFWFDGSDVLQEKTHADLIASETSRTFVKYSDFDPYNVYAIGILNAGETLTDSDKIELNRYFKLWVQYWGTTMMDSGYMKDNRILI